MRTTISPSQLAGQEAQNNQSLQQLTQKKAQEASAQSGGTATATAGAGKTTPAVNVPNIMDGQQ